MEVLRTPDARFEDLKDYPFAPHYAEIDSGDGATLRMHYLDEGEGEVILCMHGQPHAIIKGAGHCIQNDAGGGVSPPGRRLHTVESGLRSVTGSN